MSENIKMEDLVEKPDLTSEPAQVEETKVDTTEQDPLKIELEKVQRTGKTEKEKAEFSLKKNADRLKELGGDPSAILGMDKTDEDLEEDEKPVTLGMLKRMQQDTATKTAIQIAEELPSETERELAKWHLQNTIRSTGNPTKDFELAMNQVNAVKNKQILDEMRRKTTAKTHSSGSSAPAKYEADIELTHEELTFMRPPFNLTKEQIIKSRK